MATLHYSIDPDIFAAYPGYCRGVVVILGADNSRPQPEVTTLLRAEEASLRVSLGGSNVAELPAIAAWRDAYRRFGAKPSEHRSSIEAMVRRVVKPDQLPQINPLVDLGNLISLRHLLPAGVHPFPSSGQPLALRRPMAGDVFHPADGAPPECPSPNEVVFSAGAEVLTRRWTWRQGAGTQTLPETQEVFFNVDGLPPVSLDHVHTAMSDIAQLVMEHGIGQVAGQFILSVDSPSADITLP